MINCLKMFIQYVHDSDWPMRTSNKKPVLAAEVTELTTCGAGCETDLVVLAISVAAAVLRQDAALAVEHVALVALAALHTVLAAVPLAAGWGALGRAHRHTARVIAVRWTALDWEQAGWQRD